MFEKSEDVGTSFDWNLYALECFKWFSLSVYESHVLVQYVTDPDQLMVTCPSIRKSSISQSAYYAKNTQDLSMKQRHLTSVHPSNLFSHCNSYLLSKQRRNQRFFTTSAEICALLFMGKYVYNANHDMLMLTFVRDGF